MTVELAWQVVATSDARVDNLREWSAEIEGGLKGSEMIPDDAHLASLYELYDHKGQATFKWDTVVEGEDAHTGEAV